MGSVSKRGRPGVKMGPQGICSDEECQFMPR
jgi:hypothetical protein